MNRDIIYTCDVNNTKNNFSRTLYLYDKKIVISSTKQDQTTNDAVQEQRGRSIDLSSFSTTISWIFNKTIIQGFQVSYYCRFSSAQKSLTYRGKAEDMKQLKKLLDCKVLYTDFNNDYLFVSSLHSKEDSEIQKYVQKATSQEKLVKKVNLKMNQQVSFQQLFKSKLEKEVNILFELKQQKHKSILEIEEIYKESNEIIFIMKYCEGGTLYNYILNRKYQIEQSEIKCIMKRLLKGVKHLHKLGIIHRDLKLDNIVLEKENDIKSVKIIDFGFAVEFGYQNIMRCGTPGYMAPEILNQQDYNELVDIYSLGSVFHALSSGQKLYPEYRDKNHLVFLNKLNKYKISSKIIDTEQRQLLLLMIGHRKHRPSASFCLKHQFFRQRSEIPHPIETQLKLLNFPTLKNPFRNQTGKY
ncbi:unnamed protein product (macronuclear) [Paramecium tetraurelia]|uniref:Protein kinase domain-containing protein n=1 Tax=Paramecium tetraurelia TaxID=5888 RepID=A0CTA5_PARTE|nr:uncharacterized protein GSPATT00010256001 [Paramecium tetraurelia]CAK74022.1 unnamed protein product [Paramecium tetraurelia]|eukprot:XP_001441419.1 hypothetical protein (macronuclear) [Paramecium tetraurelia strain d4-2]